MFASVGPNRGYPRGSPISTAFLFFKFVGAQFKLIGRGIALHASLSATGSDDRSLSVWFLLYYPGPAVGRRRERLSRAVA